jgi:NhaA family Na+:H+ antiporter
MDYIRKPFERFFKLESSGSILLFASTIAALVIANSPLSDLYNFIWQQPLKIGFETFNLEKPLILWINDGLMAIFFFVIGLEIKREILVGELNNLQKASLPIFGAIGGMIIPVTLFFILHHGQEGMSGWGIPMATDIAFTLGILQLLGNRVPLGLKVFLTAFAIVDDIGAVMVIAIFYSLNIQWLLISIALGLLAIMFILGHRQSYNKYIFFLLGFAIWVLFLKSGIHPTIAGILIAFTIPVKRKIYTYKFYNRAKNSIELMKSGEDDEPEFLTEMQRGALSNGRSDAPVSFVSAAKISLCR